MTKTVKRDPIYLDHNASAPLDPAAAETAARWLTSGFGNPSSVHAVGRAARSAVEKARRAVAASLGASPGEIVLTSGATEALHLAICGLVDPGDHVLVSAVEHPAVYGACEVAGADVEIFPVDGLGQIDVDDVVGRVRPDTRLVVLMAAQNELGNRYPVAEITAKISAPLLCDAVQAYGKVPLDVQALGAALVVISGHKVGAPLGVGALWISPEVTLAARQRGGPQERGRRAGTENVPAIAGLGVVADKLIEHVEAQAATAVLRDRLETGLALRLGDAYVRHGGPERLPNTAAFRVRGVPGDVLLAALDLDGFCLSSGSACSSGALSPSPVLRAMGLSETEARGGLRVSLGPTTTASMIDDLLQALPALVVRIQEAERCAS